MVRTASTMLPLGTQAPAFSLPDTQGKMVSPSDFADSKALLVIFLCNHCPFVIHVAPELSRLSAEYTAKGVAIVGISSNDVANYPDDSPEKMAEEKTKQGYAFDYLYDADQSAAKAYHAACTPDFFLFDRDQRLVYRGQLDDSRPKNGIELSGKDLRQALDAVLSNQPIPEPQKPSIGCNIKWKPGSEPGYFNPSGTA